MRRGTLPVELLTPFRPCVLALSCWMLLHGCEAHPPARENATSPEVRTDRDGLVGVMSCPSSVVGVRWVIPRLGNEDNRLPGPSDYRVVALLELSEGGMRQMENLLGGVSDVESAIPVETSTFGVLLGREPGRDDWQPEGRLFGDAVPLGRSPYRALWAYRVGNRVLTSLQTQ
jgi:hypothetical protein